MNWTLVIIVLALVAALAFFVGASGDGTTPPSGDGLLPDEPSIETLFYEGFTDFNGENWTVKGEPNTVLIDGDAALNCSGSDMTTSRAFSNRNGIRISFDIFVPSDKGDLFIHIRDKAMPAVNNAKLETRMFYDSISYRIQGRCVPAPQVMELDAPLDNSWHNFVFMAETDGNALWILDGTVVMERSGFPIGDYEIRILGSECLHPTMVDMTCTELLIDNVTVISLGQTPQDGIICEEDGGGDVFKNPCNPGYCWSSGVCCPSSAPYYCSRTDRCYTSSSSATQASGGACVSFRVVC